VSFLSTATILIMVGVAVYTVLTAGEYAYKAFVTVPAEIYQDDSSQAPRQDYGARLHRIIC